jgi:hypothetical protein
MQADGYDRVTRAKVYRGEATRIRAVVLSIKNDDIRRDLLVIAQRYEFLALSTECARY